MSPILASGKKEVQKESISPSTYKVLYDHMATIPSAFFGADECVFTAKQNIFICTALACSCLSTSIHGCDHGSAFVT